MLHRAGIKLWILTGDKVQTAIEIGYSCNLLKPDMDVMIISATSKDETRSKIEAGLNKIASVLGPPRWDPKSRGFIPGAQAAFAIVIDGDTLHYALENDLKPMFLNLATQCETVVCCRVSPAQKALTVKLVRLFDMYFCLCPPERGLLSGQGWTERHDPVHWRWC